MASKKKLGASSLAITAGNVRRTEVRLERGDLTVTMHGQLETHRRHQFRLWVDGLHDGYGSVQFDYSAIASTHVHHIGNDGEKQLIVVLKKR